MRLTQLIPQRLRRYWRERRYWQRIQREAPQQREAAYHLSAQLKPYIDLSSGFFVELGGNDGIRGSYTLELEEQYGWRGLLIEPLPQLARMARQNRPASHVVQVACVADDFAQTHVNMTFADTMSLVAGAMSTTAEEDQHIKDAVRVQRLYYTYPVRVPAQTLTSVLAAQNIKQIDLLVLDVEGYEAPVLQGLDLARYPPKYMLIEARYPQTIENLITPLYRKIHKLQTHDVLYVRNDS